MTQEQYLRNLTVPTGKIDVVLDTDAYNEIDDQFAICYMIKSAHKFNVKGLCAAPFFNPRSENAAEGMIKSYNELLKLLTIAKREDLKGIVHKGSTCYLSDETTPVQSDAAEFMANLANKYSPQNPLYIVAIGAITNVASAMLKNPKMKENCVIIWLGGHATHIEHGANEFNMFQDIAAARVILGSGVPLVQLPCGGVVDHFLTSKYELKHWLCGKNALCDYLYESTVYEADLYAKGKPWTRIIWDVTAVAWLLNENERFMKDRLIHCPIPQYDRNYSFSQDNHLIRCVYEINRDELFEDLFRVLCE